MKTNFTESWEGGALAEAKVDGNLISNVKLLGRISKNGRIYSEQALEDAARLYDGVPVFFDHPTDRELRERGGSRSVGELRGRVRNPRKTGHEVRGDLQLIDFGEGQTGPGTLIRALAEQMPDLVGMSHRASGVLKSTDEGDVVESLDQVYAHELVTNPATTAGLFEDLRTPENPMDFKSLTLEEIRKNRPDLLREHDDAGSAAAELKTVTEELDRLKTENDELKTAQALSEHKALVARKLAASKLPERAITDHFREQLEGAKDEAAVDALIADRKAVVEGTKGAGPVSLGRDPDAGRPTSGTKDLSEEQLASLAPGGANSLFG